MAEKKQIDRQRLRNLVEAGMPAQQIMNELDIREMGDLEQALQGLMQETSETATGKGGIGEPGLRTRYTDRGIRIDPQMLEGAAFKPGDAFDVRLEDDRITLGLVRSTSAAHQVEEA